MTSSRIVLTGAASMVGAEVLKVLLQRGDVASIQLLVPKGVAVDRLQAYTGSFPAHMTVVEAELQLPRFGFSLPAWDALAQSFDLGIHCAQREVQDQNLDRARQTNVLPVENWIRLLERNPALRLHHLSTAFVGGTRHGLFTEFDLDCGQGFHNAWERSKFEAEVRLRESRASDRVTIHRPSHMLGRTAVYELGGAYPLLAALAAASVLPGDSRARVDFVPADYVAAAIVALLDAAGGTFHHAAGWEASPSVKQAAALAAKGRGRSSGAWLLPRVAAWPLRLIGSATPNGLSTRRLAFTTARDLLHQGPVFDTFRADRALKALDGADVSVRPSPEGWLTDAVRLAEERHWEAPAAEPEAREAALPQVIAEAAIRRDPLYREKKYHQIGDVNVAYRDIGTGEPVVFLNGAAGPHAWDGVVERIAVNRRAIIIDTLGAGDSEAPPNADFGLSAQAARVRGLLSALDIPAAHIVGNDAGGVIAEFFAVRWPHCVKSLVLSDCKAPRVPKLTRAELGQMVYDQSLLTDERHAQYVATLAGTPERRLRLKRFTRSLEQTDTATLQQQLSQLDVPTMIIWGADNAFWSPSWARSLYDTIPGAKRLELIPFAGLSCHEEKPELFAAKLLEFYS